MIRRLFTLDELREIRLADKFPNTRRSKTYRKHASTGAPLCESCFEMLAEANETKRCMFCSGETYGPWANTYIPHRIPQQVRA